MRSLPQKNKDLVTQCTFQKVWNFTKHYFGGNSIPQKNSKLMDTFIQKIRRKNHYNALLTNLLSLLQIQNSKEKHYHQIQNLKENPMPCLQIQNTNTIRF